MPASRVRTWEHAIDLPLLETSLDGDLAFRKDEALAAWLTRTGWEFVGNRAKKGTLKVLGQTTGFDRVADRLRRSAIPFNVTKEGVRWTGVKR